MRKAEIREILRRDDEDAGGTKYPQIRFSTSEGASSELEELIDTDTLMGLMDFHELTATLHSKFDTDCLFDQVGGDDEVTRLETMLKYAESKIHPGKGIWVKKVKKEVAKATAILGNKQRYVYSYRFAEKDIEAEVKGLKMREIHAAAKKKRGIDTEIWKKKRGIGIEIWEKKQDHHAQILQLEAQKRDIDAQLETKLTAIDRNNAAANESLKLGLKIAETDFIATRAKMEENLALPLAFVKVYENFQVAFDAAIQVAGRTNPTQAEVQALRKKRDELDRIQNMIEKKDTAAIVRYFSQLFGTAAHILRKVEMRFLLDKQLCELDHVQMYAAVNTSAFSVDFSLLFVNISS